MTPSTRRTLKIGLTTALVMTATVLADNVSLPHVFTAGTPAVAADVNANFNEVKRAVDDNFSRITATDTNLASLQSTVVGLNQTVSNQGASISASWSTNGNVGLNPVNQYLGTGDNTPFEVRVNGTRVMRFQRAQVGVNAGSLEPDTELIVSSVDAYANLMLRSGVTNAGGFLMSVGDVNSTTGQANFYLDSYRALAGAPSFQVRRLRLDDLGRLAINRNDTFIAGTGTAALAVGLQGGSTAYLSEGGVWTNASSRALKHGLAPIDTGAVLEKLIALPITTWEYKNSTEGRHLGPMAEDFAAAFQLGKDTAHITTVDESGVALAAIQGLNRKLDKENAALRADLARERDQLTALSLRLATLEARSAR